MQRKLNNDFSEPMICLSTSHLQREDARLLTNTCRIPNGPPVVICYEKGEYGYMVYVNAKDNDDDQKNLLEEIKNSDYSAEFLTLVAMAQEQGYMWICFDRDGPEHEGVPTFDW